MNNTVTRQVLGKIMITSKGEYNSLKSYEILDAVTYQGSSYLSKKYNNDSLPTNTNDWQLLAQKGDTYELSEEDLQRIAEQITSNANSAFNQNAKEKTDSFNSNATEKLGTYNSNHTKKLKEYNDNATSKLSAYNANTVTKTTEYNSNHTSKINAYNTNASNKVDAYNTNADTRLEEYNTNADTKINEYDEHSKELNNKIVSTRNELERLKSNVLNTGEDTDTFIHLEDSAMAELQEIKVDGVCEQNTTTGKNLLDYISNLLTPSNGLTSTLNEDGSITTTGKPIANYSAITKSINITNVLEDEQTYTISRESTNNKIYIQIMAKKATDGTLTYINNISGSNSFKVDKTTYVNYNIVIQTNTIDVWGDASLTITNKYMLYKGTDTTDTSFEPYTGGQPSPSPDYPQEIKTITDSLKITSCGKNLFDMNKTPYPRTANGLTITTKNGYFIVNGTCTSTYANITNAMNFIIPSGTYTISIDAPQNFNITLKRTFLDGSLADIILPANSLAKTFTTGKISNRYYFFLGSLTPGMTIDNAKFKIQFERKDNATSIEDYIESQIQAKLQEGEFIGKFDETHKDTLRAEYFPEEGQYHWMLDKMIGMGDTSKYFGNVKRISTKQNNYRFTFDINIDKIPNSNIETRVIYPLYCNKFIKGSLANTHSEINSISYGTSVGEYSQIVLYYSEIKDFTITQFSNWLTNNPLIIYYILQKPYTLDLGVIDMPMSYKDITNIFTDSDLLPTINAKYYRVFDKTIQNAQINEKTLKQEITDLNTTVSALDNRLKALETKTVEEPTESEGTV